MGCPSGGVQSEDAIVTLEGTQSVAATLLFSSCFRCLSAWLGRVSAQVALELRPSQALDATRWPFLVLTSSQHMGIWTPAASSSDFS